MSFNSYRDAKGYSEKTIKVQDAHIRGFKRWCLVHSIDQVNISYQEVLQFIDRERKRGLTNTSVVRTINSIRIYYDYLQASGVIKQNIISSIKIKNTPKTYLFTTKKTRDMVGKVLFKVKEQHTELIDSRQIRASVIMNWLEQYTIREVQYKAGHKTIKSTERYRREDLRDLTRQLEEYHPLE